MPSTTQYKTLHRGQQNIKDASDTLKDICSAMICNTDQIHAKIDEATKVALEQWEKETLSPANDPEDVYSDAYVHPAITR